MIEPDFSESQLQSAANSAYITAVGARTGHMPFPFIPSLHAEFLLGWDTAFDLGWLRHTLVGRLLHQHKGCNFFLQYKLSGLIDKANRSKEWATWNVPYLRFRIPHRKRRGSRYQNDFHQWDRLKQIASVGVPVYYATNTMISETELRSLFDSGNLLDRIALLDIAPIRRKHVHASFADPFNRFALHSEPEEVGLMTFSQVVDALSDAPSVEYAQGVAQLTSIAIRLSGGSAESDSPGIQQQLDRLQREFLEFRGPRDALPPIKRAVLEAFFIRRFGLVAHWCPM